MTELTAELVVDGWVPRTPVLSPDGRWVCYVRAPIGTPGEHPVSELWLVPADGSAAPRRLTSDTATESRPRWAPDSTAVFFCSDRTERGTAQLHRIAIAERAPATLTTWRAGIEDHQPLLAGNRIALLALDEPTEEDQRRHRERDDAEVRGEHPPLARLRLLDLATGEIQTPQVFAGRHVAEVTQRPDGGPLAVLTQPSPDPDPGLLTPELHLLDLNNHTTEHLGQTAVEANALTWWSTPDGWHLGYLALTPPGLQAGTAVFDLAVGTKVHHNRTEGLPACPLELHQTDGAPLVLLAEGLDTTICRLDPAGLTTLSRHRGPLQSLTSNRTGDLIAAIRSTAHDPENVHCGLPVGQLRQLTDTRPELRDIRWGTQQRLSYSASDGLGLDGLLILPTGKARADGPFPLITLVHGGPYDRFADGFKLGWYPCGQWLATAGYAVLLANPRGGQGHGHEFAASVAGAVGQAEWSDLLAGIDLLIAEGVADPDRLGIAGWSHGGFTAAWAVGQTDRFKAAIVGAGVTDWGMLAASGEWGVFETALGGSTGWSGVGPHPHDRVSPISYAARMHTPVLILHGAADTNVPLAQAEYLHRALRHFGVQHEFVVYPRENHWIRERNHQIDLLRRVRIFFDRWLAPKGGQRAVK